MVQSTNSLIAEPTYAIEPHEKPASRYYLSDILSVVGFPRPVVFIRSGVSDTDLLHLKRLVVVQK